MVENRERQEEQPAGATQRFLKSKLDKLSEKEKKLFFKLGVILALGIVLMNVAGSVGNGKTADAPAQEQQVSQPVAGQPVADSLQAELQQLLSQVKGAGQVQVIISYESGPEKIYAYDSEQSNDEGGSSQKSSLSQTNNSPVLLKEAQAAAKGVVVVAEGAADPLVRERLYQAVSSLLALPANRIAIIEGNGEV